MENTFNCIKCKKEYVSQEDEAYLCEECLIEKKQIAANLDKSGQYTTVGQKPNSEYQRYAEIQQRTGVKFVNIKDLDNAKTN